MSNTSNRNAVIRNSVTTNGRYRTETARRDEGTLRASVFTDPTKNSTRVYIDHPDFGVLSFNGREARTLFRVLNEHYNYTGKNG
jgi:hypothetical protein